MSKDKEKLIQSLLESSNKLRERVMKLLKQKNEELDEDIDYIYKILEILSRYGDIQMETLNLVSILTIG